MSTGTTDAVPIPQAPPGGAASPSRRQWEPVLKLIFQAREHMWILCKSLVSVMPSRKRLIVFSKSCGRGLRKLAGAIVDFLYNHIKKLFRPRGSRPTPRLPAS
ncbi:hypothetical protein KP509_25G049500 [Ceratopteris richardii]|uniref:Uncharacterized protein n=1 Tax=Ceratopteris richardii TaxID=49495 RepID=A0A8T2RRH2_CERRI|nr:hypothetical protein KP509_25G049500 [Ceratopteris richardii]